MKKTMTLLALITLALPQVVFGAQYQYDAAITPGSISFSPAQFYAGDTVRIYANIINQGTNDISGGVSFFQGASALAAPTPYSLKANGAPEDVWIDWVPGEGTYNIMVKIEASTTDQNLANNTYVTPMMTITKRPPPPPPPQVTQSSLPQSQNVSSPGGSSSGSPGGSSGGGQQIPLQEKKTLVSAAEQIAKKFATSLPENKPVAIPKVVKETQKSVQAKLAQTATVPQAPKEPKVKIQQQDAHVALQEPVPTITPAVLGTKVGYEQPSEQPSEQPTSVKEQNNQWSKSRAPAPQQNDPARVAIAFAVVLTLLFLGVGFFFFKKSNE